MSPTSPVLSYPAATLPPCARDTATRPAGGLTVLPVAEVFAVDFGSLTVTCPACGRGFTVAAETAGATVACSHCDAPSIAETPSR